jgi:hypothetical protein
VEQPNKSIMNSFNVEGVEIPFDNNWNSIAISLSGGADSALLAYLLCEHIRKNHLEHITVHVISHIRCWKSKPWQKYDSLKIYNWVIQEFKKINFERHTNFIAPDLEYAVTGPSLTDEYGKKVSGDNIQIRGFSEYICQINNIDAYYNAVTRNPRGVDFQGMKERDIESNENNQHLVLMKHMDRWAIHPFRFVEKSWIVEQYYKLELEELLNSTRSCEGVVPGVDYKTYKPYQYVPVCGECFWCKEREWAIEHTK